MEVCNGSLQWELVDPAREVRTTAIQKKVPYEQHISQQEREPVAHSDPENHRYIRGSIGDTVNEIAELRCYTKATSERPVSKISHHGERNGSKASAVHHRRTVNVRIQKERTKG